MQLHELRVRGRRPKKRLGRGNASGLGTYSGRGIKGQHARAGARIRAGFEGGQTPIFQRLPKRRGFRSRNVKNVAVNVSELERVFPAGTTIDRATLQRAGVIAPTHRAIKILGGGTLTKTLTVRLPVSASAREKIEKAGGSVVDVSSAQ